MGIRIDVMSSRDADARAAYPDGAVLVAALGKPVEGPFEPDVENRERPAVMIIRKRFSFGEGLQAVLAVPFMGECGWIEKRDGSKVGPMFGGRFIWTGDSRFGRATGEGAFAEPVKLMDRWETMAEYATYD